MDSLHTVKVTDKMLTITQVSLQNKLVPGEGWCTQLLSHVQLFAHQASLSVGFFPQGYWRGLPVPPLGSLPTLGIEPVS